MNTRPVTPIIALMLSIVLVAPSAFLVTPQKAYAQGVGIPTIGVGPVEIKTSVESTISAIEATLSEALSITNTAANYAQMVNTYVLQPLAFVLSGNLMKALTAGVLGFVTGKSNGTGVPQFVVDVRKSMQTVSDGAALAYLRQVGMTNSPFAGSISSALRNNYLQKSSLAGFWAANMCTLSRSSPNVQAYLAGNWSQGGVAAWFALTTQVQNNPYTLYQNSQAQMQNIIGTGAGGATGARASELAWGKGFMSWCGVTAGSTQTQSAAMTAYQACQSACGSEGDANCSASCQASFDQAGGSFGSAATGINPGDACTNADGTPGTIQTPGSVIGDTLSKVLGGQQDQIVRMGNVGPQINQILSNITSVMQTVNFAASILGGSSGGLLKVNPTNVGPTRDSSGNFTSGYLGATQSNANLASTSIAAAAADAAAAGAAKAAAAAVASGGDMPSRVAQYVSAWGTISTAANTASSTVHSLITTCSTYGNSGQATVAQSALASEIAPVLAQAAAVPAVATAALAQDVLVKNETTTSSTYIADSQKLQTMSPTFTDVSTAQYNATSHGGSTASPAGSLTVSGGSITDQMNLLSMNAATLQATVCVPPTANTGASY